METILQQELQICKASVCCTSYKLGLAQERLFRLGQRIIQASYPGRVHVLPDCRVHMYTDQSEYLAITLSIRLHIDPGLELCRAQHTALEALSK